METCYKCGKMITGKALQRPKRLGKGRSFVEVYFHRKCFREWMKSKEEKVI